jgi:hypothetical protein
MFESPAEKTPADPGATTVTVILHVGTTSPLWNPVITIVLPAPAGLIAAYNTVSAFAVVEQPDRSASIVKVPEPSVQPVDDTRVPLVIVIF